MDAVIAYVNSNDPVWQRRYAETVGGDILLRRFYDWGTLKYVLRGIDRFMPFIENVFLIVADEYQVPEYVNPDVVHIVYHRDFIPHEYLPCFNSNTIEIYMHRIPGLGEQFVYFNDDMIPMNPMSPEDFFENGLPCIHIDFDDILYTNEFQLITQRSEKLAKMALDIPREKLHFSMRPLHTINPFIKSESEKCLKSLEGLIEGSITTVRTVINVCQYLFTDFYYYSGLFVDKPLSLYYTNSRDTKIEDILDFIKAPTAKTMCLNDYGDYQGCDRETGVALLNNALQNYFPFNSKYETGAFDVVINHDISNEFKVMNFGLFEKQVELINKNLAGIHRIYVLCHNESDVPSISMNIVPVEGKKIVPGRYQSFTNLDFAEYFVPEIQGLMDCFVFMKENVFINKPLSFEDFFYGLGNFPKIKFQKRLLSKSEEYSEFDCHEKWVNANFVIGKSVNNSDSFYRIADYTIIPCNKKYLSYTYNGLFRCIETYYKAQSGVASFSVFAYLLFLLHKTSDSNLNISSYLISDGFKILNRNSDIISIVRTLCFKEDFIEYKKELKKYFYD